MSRQNVEITKGALIWPTPETSALKAALFYGKKLGWRVLPVESQAKVPVLKAWPKNATSDPQQIEAWFGENGKHWDANIGIACGRDSGIAVVDVDVKPISDAGDATGYTELRDLTLIHGNTGVALRARTPSGGHHFVFRWESLPFKSSVGVICPGVDLRSAQPDGSGAGQFVVSPSSVRNRETLELLGYGWKATIDSLDQLTDAPEWLAIRACFNEAERKLLDTNADLQSLISSQGRTEWRGLFDEWRVAARRERNAGNNVQASGGSAQSVDHPYVRAAIESELVAVRTNTRAGTQNRCLYIAALKIGSLLAGIGKTDSDTIDGAREKLLTAAAEMPDLDSAHPWSSADGQRAALKTVESGLKSGLENPRDLSSVKVTASTAVARIEDRGRGSVVAGSAADEATEKKDGIVTQCFSDVEMRPVNWAWDKYLVRGNLNVIAGNASQGKSTLVCDLAMRITTGEPWPSEVLKKVRREPGNVIIVNDEDVAADTIGPRLKAAGADLSRVFQVQTVWRHGKEGVLSLVDDVPRIEALLSKLGDVQLIVIDPINSYLNGVDSHNNAEMRGALTPLKRVAEKFDVAVLVIAHMNKNTEGSALNRVSGSLALVAASRAAFLVGVDPTDSSRRVLVPAKQNLTAQTAALAFRTVGADVETTTGVTNVSKIEWLGKVDDVTAEDVLRATTPEKRTAVDSAVEWLLAYMKPEQRYDAKDLKEHAMADMITERTLQRAKEKLKIGAFQRQGEDGTIVGWDWVLASGVVEKPDTLALSAAESAGTDGKLRISYADVTRNMRAYAKKERVKQEAGDRHSAARRRRPHLH